MSAYKYYMKSKFLRPFASKQSGTSFYPGEYRRLVLRGFPSGKAENRISNKLAVYAVGTDKRAVYLSKHVRTYWYGTEGGLPISMWRSFAFPRFLPCIFSISPWMCENARNMVLYESARPALMLIGLVTPDQPLGCETPRVESQRV